MSKKYLIIAILVFSISILKAQVTKTNSVSGIFLESAGTRTVTYNNLDFMGNSTIAQVTIEIEFSSYEQLGMFGFTFNEDIAFSLESPNGTTVNLIYDNLGVLSGNASQAATYTGSDEVFNVVIVLDDNASSVISSTQSPISGTYKPEEALSAFIGEDAIGTWTLNISDAFNNGTDDLVEFLGFELNVYTNTLSYEDFFTDQIDKARISPNPVNDSFALLDINIDSKLDKLEIYNVLGGLVRVFRRQEVYDISSFKSGVYLLKISFLDGINITKRFIKE